MRAMKSWTREKVRVTRTGRCQVGERKNPPKAQGNVDTSLLGYKPLRLPHIIGLAERYRKRGRDTKMLERNEAWRGGVEATFLQDNPNEVPCWETVRSKKMEVQRRWRARVDIHAKLCGIFQYATSTHLERLGGGRDDHVLLSRRARLNVVP